MRDLGRLFKTPQRDLSPSLKISSPQNPYPSLISPAQITSRLLLSSRRRSPPPISVAAGSRSRIRSPSPTPSSSPPPESAAAQARPSPRRPLKASPPSPCPSHHLPSSSPAPEIAAAERRRRVITVYSSSPSSSALVISHASDGIRAQPSGSSPPPEIDQALDVILAITSPLLSTSRNRRSLRLPSPLSVAAGSSHFAAVELASTEVRHQV